METIFIGGHLHLQKRNVTAPCLEASKPFQGYAAATDPLDQIEMETYSRRKFAASFMVADSAGDIDPVEMLFTEIKKLRGQLDQANTAIRKAWEYPFSGETQSQLFSTWRALEER